MSYASLEALKAYLRIDESDTTDDDELQRSLDSASSEIDQWCSTSFTLAGSGPPEDRSYHYDVPHWDRRFAGYVVEIPPLTNGDFEVFTWSDTAADWTTAVDAAQVRLLPLNAAPLTDPWNALLLGPSSGYAYAASDAMASTVLVRAYFGWIAVPAAVEEACLIQAARVHRRRDALFGVVNSPDGSSQTRLKAALDPDAMILLDGYRKMWGAR